MYVNTVQPLYAAFKDRGLEVMWVIGESKDGGNPTIQQCQDFVDEKGTTFPVMRDAHFYQTDANIKRYSPSLPNQYVINATNMELAYATGGIDNDSEEIVRQMLGVTKEEWDAAKP